MAKAKIFIQVSLALVFSFGIVAQASATTATIKTDFGDLGAGSWELYGDQVDGAFDDAWVFSLSGEDVTGAAVAIELDFPTDVTIDSVSIVKGTKSGSDFTFTASDILATGGPAQTITATLLEANEPFAVIISGEGGPGSYSGTLELAAVPIPAAAWLFGSSLLGVVWIGRRRRT